MPAPQSNTTLQQWLAETPFGLAMSSGFFGFFAHCGMLSALEESALQPARLSGSSAGALIAALWAAGLDSGAIRNGLFELDKADFWDPGPGLGLLRGQKFRALLGDLMPVRQFADCRAPLAVSVYEVVPRRTRVIDDGDLVSAVYASCCLPLLFQPLRLNGRTVVDGGVADRPGLAGMQSGRVLYHHLASRSPWRRRNGAQTRIPNRTGMHTLVIEQLTRVGPNRLPEGQTAYRQAREATLRALELPMHSAVTRLSAQAR